MKIVLGVDGGGHYKSSINLLARLKFSEPEWVFAHSVDVSLPVSGYGIAVESSYGIEFIQMANEAGQEALDEARDAARANGLSAETALLSGGAAGALIQFAEENHADLVAVHSERKGRLGSLFLGSVSRGLAIGAQHSILICKGRVSPNGDLTAVFATDHSEYADKALDRFIAMGARGITAVKVICSLHLSGQPSYESYDLTQPDLPIVEALMNEAESRNERAIQKLIAAGYKCSGDVVDAPVNEAIHGAMTSTKANLLVMGAQGHGFMHRMVLGSTSLHQAVVEPYSVLIVRP